MAAQTAASRFGATIALAVGVAAAFGLGFAVGAVGLTLLVVGGATVTVLAVHRLQRDPPEAVAGGSGLFLVGSALLVWGSLSTTAPVLALVGTLAVAVLALGQAVLVGFGSEWFAPLYRVGRHSGIVLGVGFLLALASRVPVAAGVGATVPGVARWFGSLSALSQLFVLQVLAVLLVVFLDVSLVILDAWLSRPLPGAEARGGTPFGVRVDTIPRAYWLLLGGQVFLLFGAPGAVDTALSLVPVVGSAVRATLDSGLLHLALAGLLVLAVVVPVTELCRQAVLWWGEPNPRRAVAAGAGGLATVAVAAVVSVVPPAARAVATTMSSTVAAVGVAATLVGMALVALVAAVVVQFLLLFAVAFVDVAGPTASSGVAVGAGALFVGAVLASQFGAIAPVVFGGAAAAFVVWDVGETASELGQVLGADARTARGEFVHAAGSLAVAIVAVCLATAALYGIGSLSPSVPDGRAVAALLLLLVSLSAAVVASSTAD